MSYHKTPTPTPKQDNIHHMMMSSVSRMISCGIRDITLNGKDEDIVRAFREKGLKDTCPYIVLYIKNIVLCYDTHRRCGIN